MTKEIKNLILIAMASLFLCAGLAIALAQDANQQAQNISQLQQLRTDFRAAKKQISADEKAAAKEKSTKIKAQIKQRLEEKRTAQETRKKEVLTRIADNHIVRLQNTKERLEKMPNVDESLKLNLYVKIGQMISAIEAKKPAIQSATTAKEIQGIAKEIRDEFKSYKTLAKEITESILMSRLQKAMTKAEERISLLTNQINELKSIGEDKSAAEGKLTAAKAALNSAKKNLADKKAKEANINLKKTYEILKEAVRNIQL